MSGSLAGVRVLELGGKGPTPFAGMMLSDMGADVVVCERVAPAVGEVDVLARGKLRMLVDLKSEADRGELEGVLPLFDVVMEGFRPGVAEKLGFGPEQVLAINPAIVYGRMSGYGQGNSRSGVVGHDLNFIAMSSALAHIGPADRPPAIPLNLVGDFGGAGMVLTVGILAALVERSRTGLGQVIDAAMTDASALLMSSVYGQRASGQWSDARESNSVDGGAPFYNVYETADERYVAVGALVPDHYRRVLEVCGIDPDQSPPMDDRAGWPQMRARLAAIFATRGQAAWVSAFDGVEASFAPVLTMADVQEHPYHRERESFVDIGGVMQPAPAPRFDRTPSAARAVVREQFAVSELLARLGTASTHTDGEQT